MRSQILTGGALGIALTLLLAGGLRHAEAAAATAGSDPVLPRTVYTADPVRLDRIPVDRAPRVFHERTEEEAVDEARATAERILSEGRLAWQVHDTRGGGLGRRRRPEAHRVIMEDVLARDFDVDVDYRGGGCIPELHMKAEMKAFNAIMKPAIVKKHGAQVFAIAEARARRAPPQPF